MSETAQGTQPVADNPQGTGQTAEQSQQTQSQTATAQQASQAASTQTATQQGQTPAELTALQKRLEQVEASARHHQSRASQLQGQLQALTGAQPQVDPLAEDVAYLRSKGYDDQNARDMAEFMARKLQPVLQQNQQLQSAVQGQSQAQQAYQQAIDANPELYADPKIQQATWNALNEAALAGNLNMVNPRYAYSVAAGAYSELNEPWKKPAGTTPVVNPPQFRPAGPMVSFAGPQTGYPQPTPQPTGLAPTPEAARLAAEMAKHTGVPLVQPQS